MKKNSFWREDQLPAFSGPNGDIDVDVLIVGGGITGLTTAYLLKEAGLNVAVVERQSIGSGETGRTTAHVTMVTDTRLAELVARFGKERAAAFWNAGTFATDLVETITHTLPVDCGWKRTPGYLVAANDDEKETEALKKDWESAQELGFDAEWIDSDPFTGKNAIRFANQAKFHPLKYLHALALSIPGQGSYLFENTSGSHVDAGAHRLETPGGSIHYDSLVCATHVPIQGERGPLAASLFQTKLAAYSSYVIRAAVEPQYEALFWDTNDPYLYLRLDKSADGCHVIIGGQDHKTGQENDTESCYVVLEATLSRLFPSAKPTHRWSGQVLETPDGLPYIGQVEDHQYIATGFAGNGMTLGTFSGQLLCDLLTGSTNPWSVLFDPHRKPISGSWEYIKENKDFPAHLIKDRLKPAESPQTLEPGTGAIFRIDGKKRAVYRDNEGRQKILSPVCPHMGCIVTWNDAEKSWDCPCHGSRFTPEGELIAGPAESGLESPEGDSE